MYEKNTSRACQSRVVDHGTPVQLRSLLQELQLKIDLRGRRLDFTVLEPLAQLVKAGVTPTGGRERSRTSITLRSLAPEASASAIPPLAQMGSTLHYQDYYFQLSLVFRYQLVILSK